MKKKFFALLKDKERVWDTLNLILGLLMLTALVVFWKTGNKLSMFSIIFCGGIMNVSNGFRYLRQNLKKQMGYSMIFFGVVILFLGVFVVML